jgi:hypothetical protein
MRVDELMKLLADAPPDATVCFVNYKASGVLRTVEEVEVDQIPIYPKGQQAVEMHWYVILKAEDEDDDEE